MIDPRVFLCQPIDFKGICKIYPPTVNDIVSNEQIFQLFQLLVYSQEEIEDLFNEPSAPKEPDKKLPTPLEFLLINAYQNEKFKELAEQAFKIFIHESITLNYEHKMVIFGDAEELSKIDKLSKVRYLNEDNFFDFQNVVRITMGESPVSPPDLDEDPITKRIKAAGRKRKRLASKKKSNGISLVTSLGAICCMGIGLTPLNIGEISYASVDILMTLYQQKEKYQTDIDSLMAGADPKKVHPKYWIREKSDYHEIKI